MEDDMVKILERKRDVADMMASMHSRIRDYVLLFDRVIICIQTIVSVCLCSLSFYVYSSSSFDKTMWIVAGVLSTIGLIVSIVRSQFNIDYKIRQYYEASRVCSDIKLTVNRILMDKDDFAPSLIKTIDEKLQSLPPIPEYLFNWLKQKHYYKVELSKCISKNPGMRYRWYKKELRKREKNGN